MTFCEYVCMMRKYIYMDVSSDRKFLNELFMGMMRSPRSEDEIQADAEGSYYPFSNEADRFKTSRIFNNKGDISERDAKKALEKPDTDGLYEAIAVLEDQRRLDLENVLKAFGVNCDDNDLEDTSNV